MIRIQRWLFFAIPMVLLLGAALLFVLAPRHVIGIVRDDLTGEPIADATLRLGDHVVHTDQVGQFNLGWVVGDGWLTVDADGYLSAKMQTPRHLAGRAVSLSLDLRPNTLVGAVRDAETGEPLVGSQISAGDQIAATDGSGRYELRGVRQETSVRAQSPGYKESAVTFSGQEQQDFALEPAETQVTVIDLYSQQPLADAQIVHGPVSLVTDKDGRAVVKRLLNGAQLSVQAIHHAPAEYVYSGGTQITIALRPNILRGVIRDGQTDQPLAGADVSVLSAGGVVTYAVTGADGGYEFADLPYPITLCLAAGGYARPTLQVGPVADLDVILQPLQSKGIYMPLGILTDEGRVRELLGLIRRTELNAIVVDVKNDRGWLAFPSQTKEAQQSHAYAPQVMDIGAFLTLCREEGVYTIARLVMFKDPTLTAAYPAWAVHTIDDKLWEDSSGSAWCDPFRQEVQDYNVALAKEVAALGFDELQFDYLRFPSDGNVSEARYAQESTLESRCQLIEDFCARLQRELRPYAVLLSADTFGMTAWVSPTQDLGIGQRVIDIAPYMDYLSPMLYPATFSSGSIEIREPVRHPYEVVYQSCVLMAQRTSTRVRPWLQHYSWGDMVYGEVELRAQQEAALKGGADGWIFWNSGGVYDEKAFEAAKR